MIFDVSWETPTKSVQKPSGVDIALKSNEFEVSKTLVPNPVRNAMFGNVRIIKPVGELSCTLSYVSIYFMNNNSFKTKVRLS